MQRLLLQQRGFTLLEAMISLAILSIGVLAAAAMQGHAIRASTTAYNRTGADGVAMTFVEAMQSMPYQDIVAGKEQLITQGVEKTRQELVTKPNATPAGVYIWDDYKDKTLFTKLTEGVISKGQKAHQVCDQAGKCYSMVWSVQELGTDKRAKILRLLMVWETPYGSNHLAYTTTLQNTTAK